MGNTMAVTDETFEQEIENHQGLAVVDFWAEWCGPCRMVAPIIDQLAADYAGQAKVAKMNVDDSRTTPGRFQVRAIPQILFFKDGKEVDRVVGYQQKAAIEAKFKKHLAA